MTASLTVMQARTNLDRAVRSGTHIGAPEYRVACDELVAAAKREALEQTAQKLDGSPSPAEQEIARWLRLLASEVRT